MNVSHKVLMLTLLMSVAVCNLEAKGVSVGKIVVVKEVQSNAADNTPTDTEQPAPQVIEGTQSQPSSGPYLALWDAQTTDGIGDTQDISLLITDTAGLTYTSSLLVNELNYFPLTNDAASFELTLSGSSSGLTVSTDSYSPTGYWIVDFYGYSSSMQTWKSVAITTPNASGVMCGDGCVGSQDSNICVGYSETI